MDIDDIDMDRLRALCDRLGWDFFHGPADHPLEAIFKAETEVGCLGLRAAYIDALIAVLDLDASCDGALRILYDTELFSLATAPPGARVRAMLNALMQ